jgi:hypothetical protein
MKKTTITLIAAILSLASVNTRAERRSMEIQADQISYDRITKEATAEGNVEIALKDGKTPVRVDRVVLKQDDTPGSEKKSVSESLRVNSKEQLAIEKELKNVIIPEVVFREAPISDVIDFLTQASAKKVNLILMGASDKNAPTITMSGRNMPLYDVLRLVCEITGSKLRIDDHAVVIVNGKGTPPNTYGVKLKIAQVEGQTNQFKVEFLISEKHADGKEDLLSAPRITVLGGSEGIIQVLDEGERNGVICTATVTPKDAALKVDTCVTIKRDGKVLWSCSQETTVAK